MPYRRLLIGLCVVAASIAIFAWDESPSGKIEMLLEKSVTPGLFTLTIRNGTSSEVSVRDIVSPGGHEFGVFSTSGSDWDIRPTGMLVIPVELLIPVEVESQSNLRGPLTMLDVLVVPWTSDEETAARMRSARWPSRVRAWFMRRYTVRPEHVYRVTLAGADTDGWTPATGENPVRHLQQLWRDSLTAKLKDNEHFTMLAHQVFEPGRVGARRINSLEAWQRISSTLSPAEKQTLILFGSLDDLKRDKPVWAVCNPGDLGNGFEAYLDSVTGELLFLWIIPEG